jgi:hypothetical protein
VNNLDLMYESIVIKVHPKKNMSIGMFSRYELERSEIWEHSH